MEKERERLIRDLKEAGILKTPSVEEALRRVPRELFVPEEVRRRSYVDEPLPIGEGQTVSAPHMVVLMAEALELQRGNKVLEIGTGSGYHAAVLAECVRPEGRVYTIERIPSLAEKARSILSFLGYSEVEVLVGDGSEGVPLYAPFDRISVAAAAPTLPQPLVEELAEEGILVGPEGPAGDQHLVRIRKSKGGTSRESLGPVRFVPLLGRFGFPAPQDLSRGKG